MNALSELESFTNSNAELLFHLSFLPAQNKLHGDKITEINEEEKFVKYVDVDGFYYTIPFSSWLISEGVRKLTVAINEIDAEIVEISKKNQNANEYLKLVSKRIGVIIEKLSKEDKYNNLIPFLIDFKERFDKLKNFKDFSLNKNNLLVNSYTWYGNDDEENLLEIKKLFELLSKNPKLIDCSESDFINAFTNKPVESGIKWLVKGRSGHISKPSLFYLIDLLIEKELLEDFNNVEYNSKVEYVFRDNNGEKIKNIRQSKSSRTSNPEMSERIESIIVDLINSF
ncbi:hypothetical protein [Chryseobacterium taklimakanense]|uniref:Uncharacterized protein n=1 Tax=Chryseobacterium taklimakanense TaxID=536441 RepID=A0A3G8WJQ6_9FLAO|nr:hypothetical protein [Chryseobacterium taklimakanense]AZI20723.1 hypothetical protein EIH08_08405 [Chryseobacterium taklimakanense]